MKQKLTPKAALSLFLWVFFLFSAKAAERAPRLSLESGFYPAEMMLEMTAVQQDARIFYTLDGTDPSRNGIAYEGPLSLNSTVGLWDSLSQITGINMEEDFIPFQDYPSAHVIRSAALLPDGQWTKEACGTYFIGYHRSALYGDMPVISLIMDERDLFDYETGIYVLGKVYDDFLASDPGHFEVWEAKANYTGRGMEWERPVTVDFLMAEGEGFSQQMGVRIKGGASRSATQKSLRLIAREEYGEKNIKYPLFPDNIREYDGAQLTKYKAVTLRNGGNDRDFGRIRDPYIQRLAEGMAFETAASRPVIAFINGEYWGLYSLTEEYSDNYIQYHYDIDNENVITFKVNEIDDGEEEDASLYWDMFDYIVNNPMADPACYALAGSMLDLSSFADLCALHLYIYNQDGIFQNNNWEMWRVREPDMDESPLADGKWRVMVYDTDFSSGIYENGQNFSFNNISSDLGSEQGEYSPVRMLHALMENEDFRGKLINALCDIRNLYFTPKRIKPLLQEMESQYAPYMGDTFRRAGPMWVAQWSPENHFSSHINAIEAYFNGRYRTLENHMREAFKLKNAATITVKSSDIMKGEILINGRDIPLTQGQKVQYFSEYPITITARPHEGGVFKGWKVNNNRAAIEDPTALTTTLTFTGVFTLTAEFE